MNAWNDPDRWDIIDTICMRCLVPVTRPDGKVVGHTSNIDGLAEMTISESGGGEKRIEFLFSDGDVWTFTLNEKGM